METVTTRDIPSCPTPGICDLHIISGWNYYLLLVGFWPYILWDILNSPKLFGGLGKSVAVQDMYG